MRLQGTPFFVVMIQTVARACGGGHPYQTVCSTSGTRMGAFMPSLHRVCLIPITITCSRLRRSPDLVCCVENAVSAFSTQHTKFFARRSRASTRRARAKTLSIRHAHGGV